MHAPAPPAANPCALPARDRSRARGRPQRCPRNDEENGLIGRSALDWHERRFVRLVASPTPPTMHAKLNHHSVHSHAATPTRASFGLPGFASLNEEVAALTAKTELSAAESLDDSLGKLEVAKVAGALAAQAYRNTDIRVKVQEDDGIVRVSLQEPGRALTAFSALSTSVWKTSNRIHLRGPVMIDSGHGKPVPLLDANLTLSVEPLPDEPILSGTARVPLPTFGVFNGISVGSSVSANVSARFGRELGAQHSLGADDLCLCFEFAEAVVADGPMVGLVTQPGRSGLVLNPRRTTFLLEVQASTLGGLELRGGRMAVAAAPSFELPEEQASSHVLTRGKFRLEGTFEIKPLALVMSGEAIADLDTTAGGDDVLQGPPLKLAAFGSAEFVTDFAGERRCTLNVQGARLAANVQDSGGIAELSGCVPHGHSLSGSDRLIVAGDNVSLDALLSSNPHESRLCATGNLHLDLRALPGAAAELMTRGRLLNAQYIVTAFGTTLTGSWDATEEPFAGVMGLLPLRLHLGRTSHDWSLVVHDASMLSSMLARPRSVDSSLPTAIPPSDGYAGGTH